MKRVIPALCCLLAALVLSAGAYAYIKTHTEKLCAELENVAGSDDAAAFEAAEKAFGEWRNMRTCFGALLKHSDADELEKCFLRIADCIRGGDREKLNDAAMDCIIALKVVEKGEKPNAANIF